MQLIITAKPCLTSFQLFIVSLFVYPFSEHLIAFINFAACTFDNY